MATNLYTDLNKVKTRVLDASGIWKEILAQVGGRNELQKNNIIGQ
jgi:hypothetical protein